MRDVARFFVRFFWEDAFETLLGSVIVYLVSLFFVNFDQILPLYNPLITEVPNSHVGMTGLFQIILWPAFVSTVASFVTSAVKASIKLGGFLAKSKKRKEDRESPPV